MAYTKIPVDETILANPANEETNALPYWIEACAYLFNLIIGDPDLSRLPIGDQLHALLSFWRTKRLSADRADLEDAALDLSYFGPVGKAVWYVTDKKDPQFKRELTRFATDAASAVGNHYLFYIVGTLAANGYKVGFLPEAGEPIRLLGGHLLSVRRMKWTTWCCRARAGGSRPRSKPGKCVGKGEGAFCRLFIPPPIWLRGWKEGTAKLPNPTMGLSQLPAH